MSSASAPHLWTPEEDEKLREAVNAFGGKHWKFIAAKVEGRTHTQCLQRWNKVLKPGLLKGPWKEDEDFLLRSLVERLLMMQPDQIPGKHSSSTDSMLSETSSIASDKKTDIDWVLVAENIPGRTVKQCRERWFSNLNPNIIKGQWTEEEDVLLIEMQQAEGNCWARIARRLTGRTEHAVKTRHRSLMRARKRTWAPEEDELLLQLHEKYLGSWSSIAKGFDGKRSKHAVMKRYKSLMGDVFVESTTSLKRTRENDQEDTPTSTPKTFGLEMLNTPFAPSPFSSSTLLNQYINNEKNMSAPWFESRVTNNRRGDRYFEPVQM